MQRSTKVTLAAVLFSAVLAACGGSSSSEPVVIPATVDLEVRAVSGLKFDASSYTATAGDIEVAYVNDDSIRHTLVVVEGDTKVGSFELKVNKKGRRRLGHHQFASRPIRTVLHRAWPPKHESRSHR
jgi:plastocyanin